MKFLVDECLRRTFAEQLRAAGHDATHVIEVGLAGADDAAVMGAARSGGRVLVSADTDFGEMLAAGDLTSPSVILFRTRSHDPMLLATALLAILSEVEAELDSGAIVVVGRDRARVRRLPIGGRSVADIPKPT